MNRKSERVFLTTSLAMNQKSGGAIIGTKGVLLGAIIRIKSNQEIILGRDASCCNLVMNDKKISRKHCMILYDVYKAEYQVVDYSSNGTYVNGKRLENNHKYFITSGDELWIGSEENVIRLG